MPYVVTHFLVPAIIISILREFYLKKRGFPLHYVLIAGLGGVLMDLDYLLFYVFSFLGMNFPSHRIFFHNLSFILIFLIIGFSFMKVKFNLLGKHKLKLSTIFFIISFACLIHLFLDWALMGEVKRRSNNRLVSLRLNTLQQHRVCLKVLMKCLPLIWWDFQRHWSVVCAQPTSSSLRIQGFECELGGWATGMVAGWYCVGRRLHS